MGGTLVWHSVRQASWTFLFPGLFTGLYLTEKYRSGQYKWTSVSVGNAAIRLVFAIIVLAIACVVPWLVSLVASPGFTVLVHLLEAYLAGVVLAYFLPMLKYFPEPASDLHQQLVEK